MTLHRDWRAVYFAVHGRWAIDATIAGGDPTDDGDRFDVLGRLTPEDIRAVAAAWDLKAACAAVVAAHRGRDDGALHAAIAQAEDALAKSEAFVTLGQAPMNAAAPADPARG